MKRTAKLFSVMVLLILTGLILKGDDRGQSQSSVRSPVIISQHFLLNRTTYSGPVTLFTPKFDGLFRITAYGNLTPPSNPGQMCPTVSWTDEMGSQTLFIFIAGPGNVCATTSTGSNSGTVLIHAVPNSPVIFDPGIQGFSGQYNLLFTVEEL
jgi:hypothetical protein